MLQKVWIEQSDNVFEINQKRRKYLNFRAKK